MRRYTCLVALAILAACGRSGSDVSSEALVGSEEGVQYEPLAVSANSQLRVDANVNLREAPSADARISMILPVEATVSVTDRTTPENGYYFVSYLGRSGWAYGAYLVPSIVKLGTSTAALTDAQRDNILDRANLSMGYSYWWGHGRFGCSVGLGNCSGSGCPDNCTHSGEGGADCSGMVAKAWAVPASAPGTCTDGHPYSSTYFATTSLHWHNIDRSNVMRADAFVLKEGGHIMIRGIGESSTGLPKILECKGCQYGCLKSFRSVSTDFKAIRRNENI